MEKLEKAGRIAFCIGLAGMVVPQFFYGKFGNNFFPAWPGLPWLAFWASLFTIIILGACIAIAFEQKPGTTSLLLGGLLLVMYILGDIPYELFIDPYHNHLGSWANGLKESALAGGAFVIAGSFPADTSNENPALIKVLEKIVPLGPMLFCITMVLYGYAHFLYTVPISTLVPNWIPCHIFWTYAAGGALMALGLAIIFRIKIKIAAMLLGAIIFLWLIMLHIPRAIADPGGGDSNEVIGAFSALAFSGIAFVIAATAVPRRKSFLS